MGKTKKKSRKKNIIRYNRLGMLAIALVVLILLGGLMIESRHLQSRLAVYDAKAATLEQAIEDEKERTKEIEELRDYMQADEYAEEVARERLGLVKDNEIVFKEGE